MTEIRRLLPQPVSGYDLNDESGYFTIVKAEESVNLITNPSFENTTSPYGGFNSAVLTRSSDNSRRGFFAAKLTCPSPTGGVQYQVTGLTVGDKYTFSADVLAIRGVKMRITATNAGVTVGKMWIATGNWERKFLTFTAINSSMYMQVIAYVNSTVFYTDGWQVEKKDHPTTYFDGDSIGYVVNQIAYKWSSIRNQSSSIRIAETKSGGREYKLSDLGFTMTAFTGIGLPDIENVATDMWAGGSFYQRTVERNRTITIVGSIFAKNNKELSIIRENLMSIIYDRGVNVDQPMLLRYYKTDNGVETGEVIDIPCLYQSGLNLVNDNIYQENIALSFIQFMPYMYYDTIYTSPIDGRLPVQLDVYDLVIRRATGELYSLERGFTSGFMIRYLKEINVFSAIGQVDYLRGTLGTKGACLLVGDSAVSLGGDVLTGIVKDICSFPGASYGKVAIVGTDFAAGGVANTTYVAVSVNGSWTSVKTSFTGSAINACIYDQFGNLFVAGNFTAINGVSANNIAWYNGTWHGIGSGLNAEGRAFVKSPNGDIYVIGQFTTAGGVNSGQCVRVSTAGFSIMSGQKLGASGSVPNRAMFHTDGNLYVIGEDMGFDSVTNNLNVVKWNGSSWSNVGFEGMSIGPTILTNYKGYVTWDQPGNWMYSLVGNKKTFDFFEFQNGIGNSHYDFSPDMRGYFMLKDISGNNGTLSGYTLVNNEFEDTDEITFVVKGPMSIRGIDIENTGSFIRFVSSYTVNSGFYVAKDQTMYIKFSGNNINIYSSAGINYNSKILSKSAKFVLRHGDNHVKFACSDENDNSGNTNIFSRLTGLTADNTNEGTLYYRISGSPNFKITIFKDAARTQQVAETLLAYTVAFTTKNVSESNSSGITGYIQGAASNLSDAGVINHGLVYIGYKKRALSLT